MSALTNNAASQSANAYLRTRVMTASPEELRLMLLEGAIKFANQGKEGVERADHEAAYNGTSQCRNIVFELLTTIREDLAPEMTQNVKALYTFIYTHLLEAGHEKDVKKYATVIELLEFERETWVMLMQKLAEERTAGKGERIIPMPKPANGGEASRPSISVQG